MEGDWTRCPGSGWFTLYDRVLRGRTCRVCLQVVPHTRWYAQEHYWREQQLVFGLPNPAL
jgi:hypothetical protein